MIMNLFHTLLTVQRSAGVNLSKGTTE